MASGLLSLKWNHHRSTFLHVLANIRQKESYCDVTLACAGKFYSAHKLVLSTCSEYFEEMFERTQCKHPVIVLKDIGADELEALLSYMYDGEVNVLQENLSSLIKAAECLKIKGLAVADSDPSEHSSKSTKDKNSSSSSSNSKDVHRSHNSNSTSNSNNHNSFQSDSSSRQFRNSSGGVKRASVSSKLEDGPSKRRRPEPSSLSSAAASPARRQSSERPSSAPRGVSEGKDVDDGVSDGGEGGEDVGNSMDGAPSAADDQPPEDGGSEDARSFAQGLSEQTGVKAEPVEIIDSDDMGGFDPQTGDGGSHDASDAEFTEEKFGGGGSDANDPSLWGGGANNDMFSQPSTSSFTGPDGSNSNDNNSGGGKVGGGGGGSSVFARGAANYVTSTPQRLADFDAGPEDLLSHILLNPPDPNAEIYRRTDRHGSVRSVGGRDMLDSTSSDFLFGGTIQRSMDHKNNLDGGNLSQINVSGTGLMQQGLIDRSHLHFISQTHSGVLPNEQSPGKVHFCTFCPYKTNKSTNLVVHLRTHTNEKPFACPHCPYRCTQPSHLKRHMMRHQTRSPSSSSTPFDAHTLPPSQGTTSNQFPFSPSQRFYL